MGGQSEEGRGEKRDKNPSFKYIKASRGFPRRFDVDKRSDYFSREAKSAAG